MTPWGDSLLVTSSVDAADLQALMQSVRSERCAHSWRNFAYDGNVEHLQQWENALRPTSIFFYYCEDAESASGLRLVAAATVADAIRRDFPFAGLPVLARCYIMPEFRGRGLYQQLVRHRLEFCRRRFGDGLKAIHLGTSDERIAQTITKDIAGEPRFSRIGSQVVKAGEDLLVVGAFLHFTAAYRAELQQALSGDSPPPPVHLLRQLLATMMSAQASDNHALRVKEVFAEVCASGWFTARDASSIEQLLSLCRAIPLVGFE